MNRPWRNAQPKIPAVLSALLAAVLLTLIACSDEADTQALDAAQPDAAAPDLSPGVDSLAADLAVADSGAAADVSADAAAGDKGAVDAAILPDTVGPPPSALPTNITQFVNLGDSLAYGYPAKTGLSYKELLLKNNDTKYPTWKGKDLTTKFPGIKMVDKGTIGALSTQLAAQVSALPGNPKGDTLVLISIGGNDFSGAILGMSFDPNAGKKLATQVTTNIAKALTPFADKKLYPGNVAVVLFKVHDPTDGSGVIPALKGLTGFCVMVQLAGPLVGKTVIKGMNVFNTELAVWAQKNKIMIADNHAAFLGHGYNYNDTKNPYYNSKDPTLWFYNDCLHGNDRGYHEMRRVVWDRITGGK